MPGLARLTLIGHLTREPEITYGEDGTVKASAGLTVRRKVGGTETTLEVDLFAAGAIATQLNEHGVKDELMMIDGNVRVTNGRLECAVASQQFLGPRDETGAPLVMLAQAEVEKMLTEAQDLRKKIEALSSSLATTEKPPPPARDKAEEDLPF